MSLDDAAARAAETIQAAPPGSRWFLDCDSDADGICAAAVMALALRRAGHRFQVRPSREKTRDHYETARAQHCDGYVFLDKGSNQVAFLASLAQGTGRPVLLVDHHNVPSGKSDDIESGRLVVVNPRTQGMDGSRDASAATTALKVALALDERNVDLTGIALAGAIGDWQHRGGWRGWNLEAVEAAEATGHVFHEIQPALVGVDLGEALARADPPVPGIHGEPEAGRAFVTALGLDPVEQPEELDRGSRTGLVTAWTLKHLAGGTPADRLDSLVHRVRHDTRTGMGLRQLFRVVDACGRTGNGQAALAYLLGDTSARDDAMEHFRSYREHLAQAVRRLRDEGVEIRAAFQLAWTDDPAYTGMVGGLGMTVVVEDQARPMVVLASRPDGAVQLSTRGTHEQVAAGMDLGRAIDDVARRFGLEGGGHPIASGCVVPRDQLDALLDALDAALVEQGFLQDS